ncbi:hypothetical protein RRG08_014757 [Elysia crispata]|uniref:Uncharacterized protein n=1 Tax=Elysia crispata TaxID=231223 RepID=A0AAE1AT54_9GAST|nr:hypothetical protein RRG08_014757 [Elysia crispata]
MKFTKNVIISPDDKTQKPSPGGKALTSSSSSSPPQILQQHYRLRDGDGTNSLFARNSICFSRNVDWISVFSIYLGPIRATSDGLTLDG